jgi:hypothetical protein
MKRIELAIVAEDAKTRSARPNELESQLRIT